MSTNLRAINYYKKNGFKIILKIPLIKKKLKNKTLLLESSYKKISENVKGIFLFNEVSRVEN